jgi:hypothetical protein
VKSRCPATQTLADSRGDDIVVRCDRDVDGEAHTGRHEVTLAAPRGIGWVITWGEKR